MRVLLVMTWLDLELQNISRWCPACKIILKFKSCTRIKLYRTKLLRDFVVCLVCRTQLMLDWPWLLVAVRAFVVL